MTDARAPFRLTEGSSLLLDLLRGLSAQAVLLGHALFFFGIYGPGAAPGAFVMQNFAVLVFFVLSGLLITYSTVNKIRRGGADYGFTRYFIDRFSRIFVTLVPALLLIVVLDLVSRSLAPGKYLYDDSFDLPTFVGNLLMLQDFPKLPITSFGSGQTLWTLAIEWWIYLLFGWGLLRVLRPTSPAWYDYAVLFPLLIVPSWNFWGGDGHGLTLTWIFGAIGFGVLASGWLGGLAAPKKWGLVAWFSAVAGVRFRLTGLEYEPVFAFCVGAVITVLVSLFAATQWPKILGRLVRTNAAFSYTLYLTHYSILDLLRSLYGDTLGTWTLLFTGLLISNVIAAGLGLFVEVRATEWTKRWLYRRFLPARSR